MLLDSSLDNKGAGRFDAVQVEIPYEPLTDDDHGGFGIIHQAEEFLNERPWVRNVVTCCWTLGGIISFLFGCGFLYDHSIAAGWLLIVLGLAMCALEAGYYYAMAQGL